MESLAEILSKKKEVKKSRSERAELIGEIYDYYVLDTKKQNWKRYVKWLKENKTKNTKEAVLQFKKTKTFLKTRDMRGFCFLLSHIKTQDLYYVKSVMKDKKQRGENFSGWLFSSLGYAYKKIV